MNYKNVLKPNKRLYAILFLFIFQTALLSQIVLSNKEWQLGDIDEGKIFTEILTIENNYNDTIKFTLIQTCSCFYPDIFEFELEADSHIDLLLTFDSTEEEGAIRKSLLIQSDHPNFSNSIYFVKATVNEPVEVEAEESSGVEFEGDYFYFYSAGCSECQKFIDNAIPQLEAEFNININRVNILVAENFEYMVNKIGEHGVSLKELPLFYAPDNILQGFDNISENVSNSISSSLASGEQHLPSSNEGDLEKDVIKIIPLILAGLLDGINPCAFTTLLFLLSALRIVGRSKKKLLITGIIFSIAVFMTYLLLGLGLFVGIQKLSFYPLFGMMIKWVLIIVLFLFGLLSFYDFLLAKRGDTDKIVLQLPKSVKKRLHKTMHPQIKNRNLFISSFILGFTVSLFELGCTGQIYFPTIAYMVQVQFSASALFLLILYNLAFVTPLLLVFFLTYFGLSHTTLTSKFQSDLPSIKMLSGLFFIAMAFIMIFSF